MGVAFHDGILTRIKSWIKSIKLSHETAICRVMLLIEEHRLTGQASIKHTVSETRILPHRQDFIRC